MAVSKPFPFFFTELKFGVFAGLIISASVWIEFILGLHNPNSDLGKLSVYLPAISAIAIFFLAIKYKRDRDLKGRMTFIQGLKSGSLISLISAFITTLYLWVYNHYINPGFLHSSMLEEKKKLVQEGLSDMLINRKMAEYYQMNTDYSLFTNKLLILVILGIAISAILSAALRNYRNPKKSNEYLYRKF